MSFSNLKKQSSLGSLTAKLVKKLRSRTILVEVLMSVSGNQRWTRLVTVTQSSKFLPAPDGEDLPWAKVYSHAFQGPGGWYIETL